MTRPRITSASSSASSKLPIAYAASPAAHPNVSRRAPGTARRRCSARRARAASILRLLLDPRARGAEPARQPPVGHAAGRWRRRGTRCATPSAGRVRLDEVVAGDRAHRVGLELDPRAVGCSSGERMISTVPSASMSTIAVVDRADDALRVAAVARTAVDREPLALGRAVQVPEPGRRTR